MREIKTHFQGAPFYNAFIRPYQVQAGDCFLVTREQSRQLLRNGNFWGVWEISRVQ
jgi:hypothetical protein